SVRKDIVTPPNKLPFSQKRYSYAPKQIALQSEIDIVPHYYSSSVRKEYSLREVIMGGLV
ncbi:MAG: hypothetical protein MJ105_07920, partial [Lachnospiraceae bacterium]|nr:hypothetical protein [Lachnospiraceae bacterium]